jgi:hypothetical protein
VLLGRPRPLIGEQGSHVLLAGDLPLPALWPVMVHSNAKLASMRRTGSTASGAITGEPLGGFFSWVSASASSKKWRRACAQHKARFSGSGCRPCRNKPL